MYTILLIFGFFLLIILGMSTGYIFSKRTIRGNCDGILSLGMKKVCDCETPCNTLQERLDKRNAAESINVNR